MSSRRNRQEGDSLMRLLINASVTGVIVNGFSVYCRELLRELLPLLAERGHDVELLIPRGSILEELDVKKRYLPAICGMPRKRSPLNPVCRLLYNVFILPFVTRRGDVVYSLTPHGAIWGRARQVLTVHDLIPLEFPKQHRLQYHYTRLLLPRILRHSKKVICISDVTRQALAERFPGAAADVTVIPNGCAGEFRLRPDAAACVSSKYGVSDYVLACGVGFPHKNIRLLIEAYAKLPKEVQTRHPLVVVGINTDPYAQSLMTFAASLPCAADIRFVGMVAQSDLPCVYAAARLFVYPTLCEGFGMPPIESVRCGTPCLVSNIPILRETLSMAEECYFDPRDPEDLARKLVAELSHGKTVDEGLAHRAASYSWQRTAAMALKVLEEIQ